MSTILFASPVFGPVRSRRLGVSLGINLLPAGGKVCTFDCIYCECGFNSERRAHSPMPTREEVREALEAKLKEMAGAGELPDVLTFAGNGEPTVHKDFAGIVDDVLELRSRYCPQARVAVLSNATQIDNPRVREALMKIDDNILKLDTVSPDYIARTCRPVGRYDVEKQIEGMTAFGGRAIVQTMFMTGQWQGVSVDNTGPELVDPWIEAVVRIGPQKVMIYTIDRETPAEGLRKASREQLDGIAERLRARGIEVDVAY